MARGRMISRTLSTSHKWARLYEVAGPLAEFAQTLFVHLVAHADDWGREQGDAFTVKHRINSTSPRTVDEFAAALDALHAVGLIAWYDAADGGRVYAIAQWDSHQSGLHKRRESKFPGPPERPGNSGEAPEPPGTPRNPPEIPGQEKRTEQNRTTEGKYAAPPLALTRRGARDGRKPADNVRVIARLVVNELLPQGFDDEGDLIDATKRRAAKLGIACDGQTARKAVASAVAQAGKGAR